MKKHILLIILLCSRCLWAQDNSTWSFVGPKADGASGFSPERVNCLAVDPRSGHQSNYYAGSRGGVWMSSNNGSTWAPMDPDNYMYYGGSSAMAVDPSTGYVYIASTDIDPPQATTNSVYEVQNAFGTPTWSTLAAIPSTCLVHNLQFDPWNDYLYACTTTGLYYLNGGTWHTVYSSEVYNIAFMADGSAHYYIATGPNICIESTNGSSFSNLTSVTNVMLLGTPGVTLTSELGNICLGNPSTNEFWIYSAATGTIIANGDAESEYDIYRVTESGGTFTPSSTSAPYKYYSDGNITDRLALGYKYFNASNTYLFFGGVSLMYINTASGPSSLTSTSFQHADQHYIIDVPSASNMIEASDGGFSIFNYSSSVYTIGNTPSFVFSNTDLNICQSNGFSGAGSKNFYITGDQDALHGWTYNDFADAANSTNGSTEPAGCIVSKFDNTVITNTTAYSEEYQVSSNGGSSFLPISDGPCPDYNGNYDIGYPIHSVASPYTDFESDGGANCEPRGGLNPYFQDPSRPHYIYNGTQNLNQWDPTNQVFKIKSEPRTIFSNLYWNSYPIAGAISPIDKNAFYYVIQSIYLPPSYVAQAQVVKFIGPDIDDCWQGHNDDASHWSEITPDLTTISFPFGFTALGTYDIDEYYFPAVAVSTWNPNKIWVACTPVPNNPKIKVLQYDNGTWTDYSAGIPQNENVTSLVMEIGSNDQMYLGTNRAVYYRNATSSQWETFDNYIPKTVVNDLEINYSENTIRSGTYGRGIWKSSLECPSNTNLTLTGSTNTDFEEASQYINSTQTVTTYTTLTDGSESQVINRGGSYVDLQTGFWAKPSSNYYAFIHPCAANSGSTPVNTVIHRATTTDYDSIRKAQSEEYRINVFPNPNGGDFTLSLPEDANSDANETSDVSVYNLLGAIVYNKSQQVGQIQIDLSSQPKGIYFVKAINNKTGETDVKKVIVQ